MNITIVGAGPTGLYLAIGLARRGHRVNVVDRDPGPTADGGWSRKGVMQFDQPHFFRPQVRDLLLAEIPEVVDDLLAAGVGTTTMVPQLPDFLGFRTRRSTFETVLRRRATGEPGVELHIGHADRLRIVDCQATGVAVDGEPIAADLVMDCTGRTGRLSDGVRAPAVGGDSGVAYAGRKYRLLPGAEPGPTNSPPGWAAEHDGYLAIVFVQDSGHFQPLIVRRSDDRELAELRQVEAFEAAANAIPGFADWVDPSRAEPVSDVTAGAGLFDHWRGQRDDDGRIVAGLIAVGDSVMATNPADGKGVTTSLMQAQQLLQLLDHDPTDTATVAAEFEGWCDQTLRPWFDDMVSNGASQRARWMREPIDFDQPLSCDLITALADVDPSTMGVIGPYWAMIAGPDSLQSLESRARELWLDGYQWQYSPGPTRDELAELITAVC